LADRSRRLLNDAIRVRSSGTWARPGARPTAEAEEAVAERGIDISGHRSAPFTADQAAWADLIVTMTGEQVEEVLHAAPDVARKTFTMKELVALLGALSPVDGEPSREALVARISQADELRSSAGAPRPVDEDVADPIGMSEATYRAVAWELEELTDALVRGLAGVTTPIAAGDEG